MINEVANDVQFVKAIQEKEGWPGVVAYIFVRLHNGAFRTMSDTQLKEILVEIGANEDSKDALFLFEQIVKLEEEYRGRGA